MTKITVDKDLIEQAISALADTQTDGESPQWDIEKAAYDALRAALAEPAVEPVAWMDRDGDVYKELPTPHWHPPHQALFTEAQLREALAQHEVVMRHVLDVLGPQAPECCGCKAEWNEAIKALEDVLK